ncbi:sensor histidine kinase [Tenacibaculum sp. nBUS_03]|uniref:sensor histidine kinase n=1 Tax=Tenacibaculum sp. nBUS_03 TaxID=3395320 RepID=UPI003EC017C8
MLLDISSTFYQWVRGGLIVLFVYHVIFYAQNKDKIYKFYSGYLFCLTVYLLRDIFENQTVQYYYQYISFSIQYIGFVFFINFCRELTKSKKKFPRIDYGVLLLSRALVAFSILLIIIQFLYGYEIQKKVVTYSLPITTLFSFYVFYLLSKIKTTQVQYLLLGCILFLVFANISSLKMMKGDQYLINLPVHRMFYYFVGAIIQSTFFAILIGTHYRKILEKKREVEINFLKQSNQISQLKIIALKNQMNPHFLFNSLNSINNFVIQNKIDEASNFITKFSFLVRRVLDVTNENAISLTKELEILSIYVKLEQMRLKKGFEFEVLLNPNVNNSKLKVVPLFLQPFIENAIWHGLQLDEKGKKISLEITEVKSNIKVLIIDNGIGIKKSKSIKNKQIHIKQSYGINIVKERMKLMYGNKIQIQIKDLLDEGKNGTKVSLMFPKIDL